MTVIEIFYYLIIKRKYTYPKRITEDFSLMSRPRPSDRQRGRDEHQTLNRENSPMNMDRQQCGKLRT